MEVLLSKALSLKDSQTRCFHEVFELCLKKADELNISVGYISEDSVLQLRDYLALDFHSQWLKCNLLIGMHGREGFTRGQYQAAELLQNFLQENDLGEVRIATAFKYHGKAYTFSREGVPFASIVGSSNLGNIVPNPVIELDILVDDSGATADVLATQQMISNRASKAFSEWPKPDVFLENHNLMSGLHGVDRLLPARSVQLSAAATNVFFKIPLKTEPKSNLNTYFGKGRTARGIIRPRPWYEVEIIVSRDITTLPDYPEKDTIFWLNTDDGWRFSCRTSGQNGKNLRSADDLQTLGRWIKGRLEEAGVLEIGKPVTEDVLRVYGRDFISLRKTSIEGEWIADFSQL